MRRAVLLLACIASLAAAPAAGGKHFELLALEDPNEDANANLWAHRGYAYLASYGNASSRCTSGIRVYDIRKPRRPKRVATFARNSSEPALAGTYADQVRIQHASTPYFRGDLALIGLQRCRPPFDDSGGTRGFALYDVTRPRAPVLLAIVNTSPAHGAHELWLQTTGNRAYVYTAIPRAELHTSPNGSIPGNPDFRIYDVSNPRQPVQVGQWGIWSNLGIKPTEGQFCHSVITNRSATRAYLSYWEFGTVILDITDPTRPVMLGVARDPSQTERPHAHSTALADGDRVLVETQEFGRFFNFTGTGYPRFYDISDPTRPAILGSFVPPGTESSTVHDAKVKGDRLYLSWYDNGVYALDISRPEAPREVAHFLPSPGSPRNPFCPDCTFVWGVFAYRGLVLASDMNSGLWILHVQCSVPRLRGLTLSAARLALSRGDCRQGRTRRVRTGRARRGRVLAQRPLPGARPAYPAAVALTVGA